MGPGGCPAGLEVTGTSERGTGSGAHRKGPLSLETGTLARMRPPPPTSQGPEAQHSPGLGCRGPRRPSAPPAPSRSCGRRCRSSRPRRRRCSSRGCSSGPRPGPSSPPGRHPRAWPAGPPPPSLRSPWLALGRPPAAGLRRSRAAAPALLSPTSEAETPPPSCPGTAHRSPRRTARGLGRGLCCCARPAGPSLDRGQRVGAAAAGLTESRPRTVYREATRIPSGTRPFGLARPLHFCSGGAARVARTRLSWGVKLTVEI